MKSWRIIFDLDDTLYPEFDYVRSGFSAVARWVDGKFGCSDFLQVALDIFDQGERKQVFNLALERCDIRDEGNLISEMVAVYRAHKPDIKILPEVEEVLANLKQYPLGLITDGYLDVQKQKVTALGIADHFQSIVYSDSFGRTGWKPSELPYRRSMRNLGGAPEDFVYIADNPAKDFVSAKRLGWFTVQLLREDGIYSGLEVPASHRAHVSVSDLVEVEDVLASASESSSAVQ